MIRPLASGCNRRLGISTSGGNAARQLQHPVIRPCGKRQARDRLSRERGGGISHAQPIDFLRQQIRIRFSLALELPTALPFSEKHAHPPLDGTAYSFFAPEARLISPHFWNSLRM